MTNANVVEVRPNQTAALGPLPVIYVYCVALGAGSGAVRGSSPGGDVLGCALAEDGEGLAQHLSSSPSFAKHDMGLTGTWKRDRYAKKYPNGYLLVWLDEAELDRHEGFQTAYRQNMADAREPEASAEVDDGR